MKTLILLPTFLCVVLALNYFQLYYASRNCQCNNIQQIESNNFKNISSNKENKGNKEDRVGIGQVWVYNDPNVDNPFKKPNTDTAYIIDVKGEYVQYRINDYVLTGKVGWIETGYKRIK